MARAPVQPCQAVEKEVRLSMASHKLVLGLAGAVDYEIAWDASVLEELVVHYDIGRDELSRSRPIETERDLVVAVLAFLAEGVGGECYIGSPAIAEEFAARFTKRITLGGTPVRAALAMRTVGVTCLLHLVAIDDHVRRLLPEGCSCICSAREDSTHPHLIVQFPQGARVRAGDIDLCAPHPNRLILTNDPPTRELVLSEDLGAALSEAEVFLVSGFNVIQDPQVLDQRLKDLQRHMLRLSSRALVYYEDAGFHVPELNRRVQHALMPSIDVYSMNEDEMQGHLDRSVDLLDPDDIAEALVELHTLIPAPTLAVHTKYWSLALGRGARDFSAALRGGITMATTRYVHGDHYTEREYREVSRMPAHPAGAEFAEAVSGRLGDDVCCIPAMRVDVQEPTTIGLGDTFVGGFIAALARTGVPAKPESPAVSC